MNRTNTRAQDDRYEEASTEHGAAIARVARAYEADPGLSEDLRQDIHVALWQSLADFNGRCSLRTWVYRVAHNTAASHVLRAKRARRQDLVSLDAFQTEPPDRRPTPSAGSCSTGR